jgi:hypothetical protein
VAASEDGGEELFDDLVLANDDLLQLLLHEPPMLAELLQNVAETAGLGGQRESLRLRPIDMLARSPRTAVRGLAVPLDSIGAGIQQQRATPSRLPS